MVPDRVSEHQLGTMTKISDRLNELVSESEREFARISDSAAGRKAIAGGWSRKQLLGHLIDSASNNHQRFVRALLADELRWPGYDQAGNVRVQRFQEARWSDLVQLWLSYNRLLAHVLAGVPEEKRATRCFIGENPVITLEALAEDYLVHMQHHLEQIRLKS
jgi:DinB family protein